MIKNERNKCVNLIQTSTQKAAEMKEKIKILQNEIEILRTEVSKKDKSVVSHVGFNVILAAIAWPSPIFNNFDISREISPFNIRM